MIELRIVSLYHHSQSPLHTNSLQTTSQLKDLASAVTNISSGNCIQNCEKMRKKSHKTSSRKVMHISSSSSLLKTYYSSSSLLYLQHCFILYLIATSSTCRNIIGGGGRNNESGIFFHKVEAFTTPFTQYQQSSYSSVHRNRRTRKNDGNRFDSIMGLINSNKNAYIMASSTSTSTMPESPTTLMDDEDSVYMDDFKPKTMALAKSMIFFTTYLANQCKEDSLKRQLLLSKQKKRTLFNLFPRRTASKNKMLAKNTNNIDPRIIDRLQNEIQKEEDERKPLQETIATLNKARKELTLLVGYDAALLIPCFGFAGLAAFMNSVIPHYYGACINCLANAVTTTQSDLVKAITGLASASFLCALFTGIRGALFWLAGMLCIIGFLHFFIILFLSYTYV